MNIGIVQPIAQHEPKILEPNKIERWEWFELDSLPEDLSPITSSTIEVFKKTDYSKF